MDAQPAPAGPPATTAATAAPGGRIEFWYDFASPYAYLAAMRIDALAGRDGIDVVWRPFLLGPIFRAQGWRDSPFNLYPAKGRYLWRDVQRLANDEGVAFHRPSHFPRHSLLAARVALLLSRLPHSNCDRDAAARFSRAVLRANFAEDRDIGDPRTIEALLRETGLAAPDRLARALAADNRAALHQQTQAAMDAGIFGAPSFLVGDELFWGSDRLEAALRWAKQAAQTRR